MNIKETTKTKKIVEEYNKTYAFVMEDGKPVIWYEEYDEELDRLSYIKISRESFVQMYEDTKVAVYDEDTHKPKTISHAELWLQSDKRRKYLSGTVFDPNPERVDNPRILNLWKSWQVEPKQGDWSTIETHIREVICNGDAAIYPYVKGWLATLFQKPHLQAEVALIVRGKKGCGKGQFGHFIRELFGNAGLHINNASHLIGRFNAHLRTTAFLFVDEAIWAGNIEHENILKTIITDSMLTIEEKHGAIRNRRNRISILMLSNNDYVAPASNDERRFCVIDASDKQIGNRAYMTTLAAASRNPDVQAAFLYEMLNYDLSNFEIRDIPETQGLSDQRMHSLDSLGKWWFEVLTREQVYLSKTHIADFTEWRPIVSTDLLYASYELYCQQMNIHYVKNRVELGKFLSQMYLKSQPRELTLVGEKMDGRFAQAVYSTSGKRTHCYLIQGINEAKQMFSEVMKIRMEIGTTEDD